MCVVNRFITYVSACYGGWTVDPRGSTWAQALWLLGQGRCSADGRDILSPGLVTFENSEAGDVQLKGGDVPVGCFSWMFQLDVPVFRYLSISYLIYNLIWLFLSGNSHSFQLFSTRWELNDFGKEILEYRHGNGTCWKPKCSTCNFCSPWLSVAHLYLTRSLFAEEAWYFPTLLSQENSVEDITIRFKELCRAATHGDLLCWMLHGASTTGHDETNEMTIAPDSLTKVAFVNSQKFAPRLEERASKSKALFYVRLIYDQSVVAWEILRVRSNSQSVFL